LDKGNHAKSCHDKAPKVYHCPLGQEEQRAMDLFELEVELNLLLTQMENLPEDKHEFYLQLREKLSEMRAFGMPVPDDLLRLEKELEKEFTEDLKSS